MASQLHSSLVSVATNEDIDEFRNPRNQGETMSQQSSWNPIDRYGESLHSSEVVNVRELKFCEGCGALFVRLSESKAPFCAECNQLMPLGTWRIQ